MKAKSIVLSALQPFFDSPLGDGDVKDGLFINPSDYSTGQLQLPVTHSGGYLFKNSIIGYLDGDKLPVEVRVTRGKFPGNDAAIAALIMADIGATYVTETEGFRNEEDNDCYCVYIKVGQDKWHLLFDGTIK